MKKGIKSVLFPVMFHLPYFEDEKDYLGIIHNGKISHMFHRKDLSSVEACLWANPGWAYTERPHMFAVRSILNQ